MPQLPPSAPAAGPPPPDPPELPEGVERPGPAAVPRWPAWSAPLALFAALALTLVGGTVIAVVAGLVSGGGPASKLADLPVGARIASLMLQDAAFALSAVVFAALATRPRAWHFGVRPASWRSSLKWLFAVWFGFFAFSVAWFNGLGIKPDDSLPDDLGIGEGPLAAVAVTFLVTVVAPITEELFFRGYFFTALRSWRGPWLAAILTGLTFGAIHVPSAPVSHVVPLAAFGFGLCLILWRTGSLYPCIALHALNNSLALGVSQDWRWWQVIAVMVGANLVIAALVWPLGRGAPGLAPALR